MSQTFLLLNRRNRYRMSSKMATAKQLYQLQEVDLEIETGEQALKQLQAQLGEDQTVIAARTRLAAGQDKLAGLKKKQKSTEWDSEDLTTKIKKGEEELYSGRIRNPKELMNLQQEANAMKARRDHFETDLLGLMDRVEAAEKEIAAASDELKRLEAEWRARQQKIAADVDTMKNKLARLKEKRQGLAADIEPAVMGFYEKLKKSKGLAVVKVEQGICRGCRISLPTSEIQRVRSGTLVQCSSCGRILFLP